MKKNNTNSSNSVLDYKRFYDELSIDITKNNLREFDADIVYHKGYIPDSLESEPKSPNSISYLHIDLNAVNPTMDVLSFFLPNIDF